MYQVIFHPITIDLQLLWCTEVVSCLSSSSKGHPHKYDDFSMSFCCIRRGYNWPLSIWNRWWAFGCNNYLLWSSGEVAFPTRNHNKPFEGLLYRGIIWCWSSSHSIIIWSNGYHIHTKKNLNCVTKGYIFFINKLYTGFGHSTTLNAIIFSSIWKPFVFNQLKYVA